MLVSNHSNYDPWPGDMTIDDLCAETGLPKTTLTKWTRKGYIQPWVKGSKGRSKPHIFGRSEVLAVRVAGAIYLSARGCRHEFVVSLLKVFSRLPYSYGETVLDAIKKRKGVDDLLRKSFLSYDRWYA